MAGSIKMLSEELCTKIGLSHDAAEILRMFNSDYAEQLRAFTSDAEEHLAYFFQVFLYMATYHNHTDLVGLLLPDARCTTKSLVGVYPSSLFAAIEKGNFCLVDAFLRANSSLDVLNCHTRHFRFNSKLNNLSERMSSLAYACDCDKPAIVNRLVSYYIQQYPPSAPGRSKVSRAGTTPLHIILDSMCKHSHRTRKCSLPKIFQHFIDNGGDINECDFLGCSPLLYLITKVRKSVLNYPHKSMMNSVMVISTLRMMLAAGALARESNSKKNPLDILINLTESFPKNMLGLPSFVFKRDQFVMIADLIKLLLQHGATISGEIRSEEGNYFQSCPGHIRVIRNATKLAKLNRKYFSDARYLVYCACEVEMRDAFAGLMDSMADILRSFILAAGGVNDTCACRDINCQELSCALDFVRIVEYSTRDGNSAQFMRVVLDTLSALKGNFMRKMLLDILERLKRTTPEESPNVPMEKAVELLTGKKKAPLCLRHLARSAIVRAMSHRCLGSVSALGIPCRLEQYILSGDN